MMDFLLILIALPYLVIGIFSLEDSGKDFNNCLTWRDDIKEVTLICRVPSFALPVIFYHNNTKTEVECFISKEKLNCSPGEKTSILNKSEQTVTIVLIEEKDGRNLNGTWYCKQGESILTTRVSTSKGIIVDSWVKIQGNIIQQDNNTRHVEIVCSSCRMSQGRIAEFAVNGKTKASVWQDDEGSCIYKSSLCPSDLCNCSPEGNLFSLRIQYPVNQNTTEFACELQFTDPLRKGRFAKTALMILTDDVFIVKETIERVIKKSEPIRSGQMTTAKFDSTTKHFDDGSTLNTTPLSSDGKVIANVIAVGTASVFFIILILLLICYIKNKSTDTSTKGDLYKQNDKQQKSPMCKGCSQNLQTKQAEYVCLDCREYLCLKCRDTIHNATKELQQHKTVKTHLVPKHLSLSLFNCGVKEHECALLEYLCNTHKEFICRKCLVDKHSPCETQMPCEIPSNQFIELVSGYQFELDSVEEKLKFFQNFLERSSNLIKLRVTWIGQNINSLTQKKFKIEKKQVNVRIHNLSKQEVMTEINKTACIFEKYIMESKTVIKQHQKHVEIEKEMFAFVSEHGGFHHIMTIALSSNKRLIKTKIALMKSKTKFMSLDISIGPENNTIIISYNISHEIKDNSWSTTPSRVSNTSSIIESELEEDPSGVSIIGRELEEDVNTLTVPENPTKPTAKILPRNDCAICLHAPQKGQIQIEERESLVDSEV